MKKARRMYEKILQQMENVCCLPEASVSVEWKSGSTLCCPSLLPRSPEKMKTKFHVEPPLHALTKRKIETITVQARGLH